MPVQAAGFHETSQYKDAELISPDHNTLSKSLDMLTYSMRAQEMVQESKVSQRSSGQDLQSMSIDQLEEAIQQEEAVKTNAEEMAASARALGLEEECETIQSAKLFWDQANTAQNEMKTVLNAKKAALPQKTFSYDVFTKTNLSADDYNKLLAGSSLAGHGQDFYDMEQTYGVNGLFALSVARTESGLGSSVMAKTKNNFFGMIGCKFSSSRSCILYFGELMNKSIYKGKSIEQIAAVYCPPTHSQWAEQNRSFMRQFWEKL